MNRRKFIKNTSTVSLGVTALSVASCNTKTDTDKNTQEENSKSFSAEFELNEISIHELQQKMQSGQFTSKSITEMYLKRIQEIDKNGPALNSVIEINPDAIAIAVKMDEERKAGKVRGPMHGIPFLIKDNINTGDKMMTTAGSLALDGHHAEKDAFIINQLREAGAVLLGKTNLSEWANFRSTNSTSGWSSRGGQTKNPNVLDRNPCGSSAGSAAAVTANLCAIAIGTETDGSIIGPSSFCGIVGIKPTVGLLSRSGIIPISKTQDTAGPIARTVTDAAILLGALTGIDENDTVTLESKNKFQKDYTQFLDANALSGKRIGIEKSSFEGHEGVVELYKKAIEVLKKQGATIIETELLKTLQESRDAEFLVLQYEFKDGLNKYLTTANTKVKSLTELIAFNKQNESQMMPYFKQEILEKSEALNGLDSKEYTNALAKSLSARKIIDNLFIQHQLDAIAGTSAGLPFCIDLVNGDYNTGAFFTSPAARAGYPHITVPMGKVHELPIGFSFFARAYEEPVILKIAFAFEQAYKKREMPKFLASVI